MTRRSASPIRILLVEDDEVCVIAMRRAFRKAKIDCEFSIARDGLEGLEMLRGKAGNPSLKHPLLILLDLRMPRMDGLAFLRQVRDEPSLTHHVIFVLTTSDDEQDVAAAYKDHVAGYILKHRVGENYEYLIQMLKPYWDLVELR